MINILVGGQVARDPGVLEGGLAGVPDIRFNTDEMSNEILGGLADVVPVRRVEFVLAAHDLVEQVVIIAILIVEGRITAEQDVGNHADRPHVDGLSISEFAYHFQFRR